MDRGKIEAWLKETKNSITTHFPDAKVLVCGSYARGEYIEGVSDIDIVILSESFRGKNLVERIHMITEFLDYPDFPIDIIPLLPEEYDRKSQNKLNTLYYMAKDALAI